MRIIVVFNREEKNSSEKDIENLVADDSVKTAREIAKNLRSLGHQTKLFELTDKSISNLLTLSPDLFFNQAWGIGSDENSEDQVIDLLEKTGVPYTGSDQKTIRLTQNKSQTKILLQTKGITTPNFQKVSQKKFRLSGDLNFPLIIKPDGQDCSLGIDARSIFTSPRGIEEKVAALLSHFGESVLIEEYIDGRELNTTILGNGNGAKVLPVSEITFGPSFKNKYKIVDFSAKWQVKSRAYRETIGVCPAKLSDKELTLVQDVALKSFMATACHDYARVDIRLSKEGVPYVLEINANPAIGPKDGAVRSARAQGYSYPKFLEKIAQEALGRESHQ